VRIGCEVTAARARVFFGAGLLSALDLVRGLPPPLLPSISHHPAAAGPQELTRLLLASLPFYGRQVLDVTRGPPPPEDATRAACERLALKITSRLASPHL